MDESTLPDVAQLLSSSTGSSTRVATCTAIAACSSGEKGALLRRLLGTTSHGETIIRRLLLLCADPASARFALSALVNIAEDEHAATTMTRAGAVERAATALLDAEQRHHASLYAGLLSNLTRFPSGVDSLVGKGKGSAAAQVAVHTLFRLVTQIDRIPNVLWMSNACSTPEGRAALLLRSNTEPDSKTDTSDKDRHPLTWLLRLVTAKSEATRLAAASALRNCAMAEDCHDVLVEHTNAIGTCLSRLMTPKRPVPLSKLSNAPSEVREVALNVRCACAEPLVEIRLILVEALLLLCKSAIGRASLRDRDAYSVLEEWEREEENNEVKQAISSIMDRIVAAEDTEQGNFEKLPNDMAITESLGRT